MMPYVSCHIQSCCACLQSCCLPSRICASSFCSLGLIAEPSLHIKNHLLLSLTGNLIATPLLESYRDLPRVIP